MIPKEDYERIFEEYRQKFQAEIDAGRDYFLTPERPHDAEYCDFLRELGYRVPDDWPTEKK